MIGKSNIKKIVIYFISIIVFFSIWSFIANSIDAPLILPSVGDVFSEIYSFIQTKKFWINFLYTLYRVLSAFFISLLLGLLLGFFCGISNTVKSFFEIPLSFIRSTPVVAIILVALFWFNSSIIPIFVAILMCLPIVVSAIIKGLAYNDNSLMYMAQVYNFSFFQKIKYIKLKSLKPFFLNSAVNIFGLSWKVVVAGEVISIPKYGFGSLMQLSQVHLETASVMAITLMLVTFSFCLEKIFSVVVNIILKNQLYTDNGESNE